MKFLRYLGKSITDQEKGNPRLFLTSTMELENRDFRAVIYYDLKRGLTYHESHTKTCVKLLGPLPQEKQLLASGFGSLDMFGRSHFNNDNRCGQPVSAATQENAAMSKN